MINVAVIGLGVGRTHLATYQQHPDATIRGVVDIDTDLAADMGKTFGVSSYASINALLANQQIDAASICTPPGVHADQVETLTAAGVHVLLEKPIASSLTDCRRIIDAGDRANVTVMVAQKKRFIPAYAFLKERFGGEFGQPLWVNVKYALGRVTKPWFWDEADGGGPIVENAIHVFDLIRFLMGDVESVFAEGGNLFMPDYPDQIDTAAVVLRFVSGGIGNITCGYGSEWGFADERISIATPKVVCEMQGRFDGPQELRYIYRDRPDQPYTPEFDPDVNGFEREIDAFLSTVESGGPSPIPAEDAARSLAVALAVKQSAREGQRITLGDGR